MALPGKAAKCYVETYHGNNCATFVCMTCGHRFRSHMIDAKRWKLMRNQGEQACRLFANWWSKANGGVTMECFNCIKVQSGKVSR